MTPRLAIEGGSPVRSQMLPYGRHFIDEADIQAVVEVLRSDWLTTGPKVAAFEEAFAAQTGAKYAVAVSNGTAALHAAAYAAGIGSCDEVIVTPLTFVASANCVRYQNGTVVFSDVRADTLTLDPARVEELITERTKAIVTMDYAGHPSQLTELRSIAQRHGLILIEDASHALGATYNGRQVGSIAPLTTFSLHPVKHITTGEGGVVTTDDEELARRIRAFRTHGIPGDHHQRASQGSWFYDMEELGYNYRLTDMQCALGMSQLGKLSGWIGRRREIAARYTAAFADLPELELPTVLSGCDSVWHLYVVRLNLQLLRVGRAEVFRSLRAENIGVNVHYIPVPWHSYYRRLGFERGRWPVAESAYERMLTLPMFPAMRDDDVADVITAVKKVIEHFR